MPKPNAPWFPEKSPLFNDDVGKKRSFSLVWQRWFLKVAAPRYETAAFPITDTAVADGIGYPWPVRQGGPLIEIALVANFVPTGDDLVLRFRLNGKVIGTLKLPEDTPANTIATIDAFDVKNLALEAGDLLSFDITASDATADPLGVAIALVRWIAE